MAFNTSSSMFDSVFGSEPEKIPSEHFITELGAYLYNTKSPLANKLGDHIKNGGLLSTFTCRAGLCSDVADELYENDIPFVIVASSDDRYGFVVRKNDSEQAKKAGDAVLIRKGRACIAMSGEDMQKQAAMSGEGDRTCISIHGLKFGQAQLFKKKFTEYNDAAKVGIDFMEDKTYTLTFFAKDSIKKYANGDPDLCRIYLEVILATGGPYRAKISQYAEAKATMTQRLANNFVEPDVNLKKTPLWIVGNGWHYMKVDINGFVYGQASVNGEEVSFSVLSQADIAQPDYHEMLVSYASRIVNPSCTYNHNEIMEHFKHLQRKKRKEQEEKGYIDVLDTVPSPEEIVQRRGEKQLAALLDTMIMRKIQNDPIMVMDGRYHEKFSHYVSELKNVMKAFCIGRIPIGYSKEDHARIREVLNKYNLDGEMYEQSLINLKDIEAVEITGTIERIADISERIQKGREEQQRKAQEKQKARAARTRSRIIKAPAEPEKE